jgi:hypothetical protein
VSGALHPFRVAVTEDGETFWFLCQAENTEHAVEQALNAYPTASANAAFKQALEDDDVPKSKGQKTEVFNG